MKGYKPNIPNILLALLFTAMAGLILIAAILTYLH